MKLNKKMLKNIVKAVTVTHDDELSCDECFKELDRFVEMKLEGKSPEEAMPLVKEHLKKCGSCQEEYKALLESLKAIA